MKQKNYKKSKIKIRKSNMICGLKRNFVIDNNGALTAYVKHPILLNISD